MAPDGRRWWFEDGELVKVGESAVGEVGDKRKRSISISKLVGDFTGNRLCRLVVPVTYSLYE